MSRRNIVIKIIPKKCKKTFEVTLKNLIKSARPNYLKMHLSYKWNFFFRGIFGGDGGKILTLERHYNPLFIDLNGEFFANISYLNCL